jgi:hypothetical protein
MPRRKRSAMVGRRGRPTALSTVSTIELHRELSRRQSAVQDLIRKREELNQELQALESVFGSTTGTGERRRRLGRPGGGGRRGRPPGSKNRATRGPRGQNAKNLVDSLRGVLTGKTMSVAELTDAVQQAGYKTNSANFRTIVNQALLANPRFFRKVSRGQYTTR